MSETKWDHLNSAFDKTYNKQDVPETPTKTQLELKEILAEFKNLESRFEEACAARDQWRKAQLENVRLHKALKVAVEQRDMWAEGERGTGELMDENQRLTDILDGKAE